ncbi:cob(I)yrinic acid a,c-diamide adenosyltransferase [Bowmanella denitrificans]|uniref:Corrinoid adenosyltransferase n=1 Tax=Bowmanella denitrificans TaxID=366582 RepID=A0ABP3GQ40_9ALTE
MKIYTKGGDQGTTQIYVDKPERLGKQDIVLECYGTLDELNAHLGMLACELKEIAQLQAVQQIQQQLFQIGFALSASSKLTDDNVQQLEQQIDLWQSEIPPQTSFILPGGCHSAAQAHICRTIARRAERRMVELNQQREVPGVCLRYLNRLSDWLFVLARVLNFQAGMDEPRV